MSNEDYTPITADQVQVFAGPTESLNGEQVAKFINIATEHKLSADAAKAVVGFNSSAFRQIPEYVPMAEEGLKSLYSAEDYDETQGKAFLEVVSGHKLGEEAVKALVAYDQSRMKSAEEATLADWENVQTGWKSELEKDSLLTGGDGYEKNLARIATVIKDYGGQVQENGMNELQEALNVTGMGNHPAMGRFMMRLVEALPKEGAPAGGNPPGSEKSPAEVLFPTMIQGA